MGSSWDCKMMLWVVYTGTADKLRLSWANLCMPAGSVACLCLTLFHPMDCSPPGSSIHGISQARILEWVAISFSRGSSQLRVWTHFSCIGRQILYHWAMCMRPSSQVSAAFLVTLPLTQHPSHYVQSMELFSVLSPLCLWTRCLPLLNFLLHQQYLYWLFHHAPPQWSLL